MVLNLKLVPSVTTVLEKVRDECFLRAYSILVRSYDHIIHHTSHITISSNEEEEENISATHRNKVHLHVISELDELDAFNGAIHGES